MSGDQNLDRALPVTSWVLYDFANTVFYAVVVTRYLGPHLLELTGKHTFFNWGFYPSMLAAALFAPWLGRFAGTRGVSRKSILLFTVVCCIFTACLGFFRTAWPLVITFALAQVCYQLALVPYNNLLPSVASKKRMGLVSGLGVGIGYLGVIVSLKIADHLVADNPDAGYAPAYIAAAVLFLLFSLPLFLFVPEKTTVSKSKSKAFSFKEIMGLLQDRCCRRFVIGNFLCSDALNAILVIISVYVLHGLGFNEDELLNLLIVLNVSAMISGILFGYVTDRIEPRRAMPLAGFMLATAIAVTHFSGMKEVAFWSIVCLGGPGVAGLWVAGRKWVVQLAPAGDVGTLFGFYGLSNKLSLVNLALFAILADLTGGYTLSVTVLVASLLIGTGVLLSVPKSE